MAALPAPFSAHLQEEDALPPDDDALEVLETLSVTDLRTIVEQALDLLPTGAGDRLVALGVPRDRIGVPLSPRALRKDPGFKAILEGERTLSIEDCPTRLTSICQRALQAIAGRVEHAPTELALPRFGHDRVFGGEVGRAIRALQAWLELEGVDATLGKLEAEAIVTLLEAPSNKAPRLFLPAAPRVDIAPGRRTSRIVNIARALATSTDEAFHIRVDGRRYSYKSVYFGTKPSERPPKGLLRAPDGVAYGVDDRRPYWKCNLFGGMVLSLANIPVPTFRVGRFRHYPRAERFGPALARKTGWKMVRYLDHRDPAQPTEALVGTEQDAAIKELLLQSLPGDLFFVDHPGEPGEDGGHTRVCVDTVTPEDRDGDAAPLWAQAGHDAAILRRDGLAKLGRGQELQFWLLRYTR